MPPPLPLPPTKRSHPDTGAPTCTASKGFLSWNMMAAHLIENLEAGVDPTAL